MLLRRKSKGFFRKFRPQKLEKIVSPSDEDKSLKRLSESAQNTSAITQRSVVEPTIFGKRSSLYDVIENVIFLAAHLL